MTCAAPLLGQQRESFGGNPSEGTFQGKVSGANHGLRPRRPSGEALSCVDCKRLVHVGSVAPFRYRDLCRAVPEVAGDQQFLPAHCGKNGVVPRRMARRVDQGKAGHDFLARFDHLEPPRVGERHNRASHGLNMMCAAGPLAEREPVPCLPRRNDMSRPRKGLLAIGVEHPTHMVYVQMGEHHKLDAFGWHADRLQGSRHVTRQAREVADWPRSQPAIDQDNPACNVHKKRSESGVEQAVREPASSDVRLGRGVGIGKGVIPGDRGRCAVRDCVDRYPAQFEPSNLSSSLHPASLQTSSLYAKESAMTHKISRRALLGTTVTIAGLHATRTEAAPTSKSSVEISYWQYYFKERVIAMDELIKRFQSANPDILVKQVTFPYAQYRTKIAAAVPAGEGPDVFQLYYGWLRDYRRAQLVQPLPTDLFPPAELDRSFFPFVRLMQGDGAYWAIPTAVRSMGLFYNKKLLNGAATGPVPVPETLDDFVAGARAISQVDHGGNLIVSGTTIGLPSQDSHWWREVLVRQFGGRPYTDDYRRVTYGDESGAAALRWYTDLQRKYHVAAAGFMTEPAAAFRAGRVGLHVNASFLVGALQATHGLDWGVGELPSRNGVRANYASYWVNALASGREGARRDAAARFLAFVTTDAAMALWLSKTGELPARRDTALAAGVLDNVDYAAFAKGLSYAVSTDFADEDAQRAVFVDMLNRVLIQNQDPLASVREAAMTEQRILDAYYAKD